MLEKREKAIKGIKYFSYEKETLKWNISRVRDEKGKFFTSDDGMSNGV